MKMNNTTHSPPGVRIVTLPPGRMACYQASGEHPELAAWKVLLDWADKNGLLIATGQDYLLIHEVQLACCKRMTIGAFLAGHPITPGQRLG